MERVAIREGSRKDSTGFLKLVVALANFEGLEPPDAAARRRMASDLFGKRKGKRKAELFMAYAGKLPIGYALYFYTYSSFFARPTLYLEDIFVLEEFRRKGVGRSLFMKCVEKAKSEGCGRIEFSVLYWNEGAMRFYEKLGARKLSEWYSYRLTSDKFGSLTGKKRMKPSE